MYKGNLVKHLRAFRETARLGSVSAAAEALFLSQPSVSQQISALEEQFGQTLFERRRQLMELTAAGRALIDIASPALDRFLAIPDEFAREFGNLETGEIHIAAGESTILYLLPVMLQRFRERHPGIYVHLHNVTGAQGMGLLRSERADFAVGSLLDVPPDIEYRPIFEFAPELIMSPDHPLAGKKRITLEDISKHGLILPPRRLTTYRLVDRVFVTHGLTMKVTLEVGGWEIVKKYVGMNMGISIVTGMCLVADDRLRLVTRDVSRWFPKRSYGVVYRRGAQLSPQSRRFIELITPELYHARGIGSESSAGVRHSGT